MYGFKHIVPGMLPEFARVRELGVIPSATTDRDKREYTVPFLLRSQSAPRPMLPATTSSVFSESVYAAVASILRADCNGTQPRVITVTSAVPGDGKTTVTTNLGLALANIQFRVALIEGDLRHPRLSNSFKIANSWGVSDVLQYTTSYEDMPIEALAKRTDTPGLFALPSGPSVLSVSSALHSPRWSALLDALRRHVDVILIDSPPLLAVSDARILGSLSEAVILVVRAHETARATFQMAMQQLVDDRTPVLGTIINGWNRGRVRGTTDPFQYQYPFRYKYTSRE